MKNISQLFTGSQAHFPAISSPDLKPSSNNSKHSPVTAISIYVAADIIIIANG